MLPVSWRAGIKGAHEKGGVEGEVGRFRRNFLTPVPAVRTLAELNAKLRVWDEAEDGRRISQRLLTIGQEFAVLTRQWALDLSTSGGPTNLRSFKQAS